MYLKVIFKSLVKILKGFVRRVVVEIFFEWKGFRSILVDFFRCRDLCCVNVKDF